MIRVAIVENQFGKVEVFRAEATGSLVYVQGGCYQTESDANGVSLVPYIHALYGLVLQMHPRDVLLIGCGGGSLGRMLAGAGISVTIVDINPASISIARDHFGLPASIVCHAEDGAEFLASSPRIYDAIVSDAFCGDEVPAHLAVLAFFELVRKRLNPQRGCLFANIHVMDDSEMTALRYARRARGTFDNVRLLDARGGVNRNAIVAAGDVLRLEEPALSLSPLSCAEAIASELGRLQFTAPLFRK